MAFGAIIIVIVLTLPITFAHEQESDLYINPQPVTISGYEDTAMEPFISPDGKFLFFNNWNDESVNTNLHFARRTGKLTFKYLGELPGVNSDKLDAVASMDRSGNFYFTTVREYERTFKSLYTGHFDGSGVSSVAAVAGEINPSHIGVVNMDAGVSPDGQTLYVSRTAFLPMIPLPGPIASDLFIARRDGNSFRVAPESDKILKQVNTKALEYAPAISPDGLELYFTRASIPAGMRLMVATRASADAPFNEARVLKSLTGHAVEAPTISSDMSEMFFHQRVGDKYVIFRAERNGKRYPKK